MKKIQVKSAGGNFELVEEPMREPAARYVRVKVQACGVCHSDSVTKDGLFPGIVYPRSPGHEIMGVIDAVGEGTEPWKAGDRVGIGWHGGHCGRCESCRRGDFVTCVRLQIPGISYDGGYSEFVLAPFESLARVPSELTPEEAAPLMCAGVTTFNALRNSGARAGDLVAIHGVGGLGHLGIQFAERLGFRVVAVSRGAEKEKLARSLGAHEYIDSEHGDPAAALRELGGARAIIATVTDAAAMQAIAGGLGSNGTLMVIGAVGSFPVDSLDLLRKRAAVKGWYSGTSVDSEDTLRFSQQTRVISMNEIYPLEEAQAAYERMMSGKARFRVVLRID